MFSFWFVLTSELTNVPSSVPARGHSRCTFSNLFFSPLAFSFALSSLNLKPLSLLSSTFSPLPAEKRNVQHCEGGDSHAEPRGQAGLWQSRLMEPRKPVLSLDASIEASFRRKEGHLHFPFMDFFPCKRANLTLAGLLAHLTLGTAKTVDLHYPLYLYCKHSHGRWGHSPPLSQVLYPLLICWVREPILSAWLGGQQRKRPHAHPPTWRVSLGAAPALILREWGAALLHQWCLFAWVSLAILQINSPSWKYPHFERHQDSEDFEFRKPF